MAAFKSVNTTHPRAPASSLHGVELHDPRIRSAHIASLWDGIFCTIMIALTETFVVAAAVSLAAPPLTIGILGSLPMMLGTLTQLLLPRILSTHKGKRRIVMTGTGTQAFFLVICGAAGLFQADFGRYLFLFAITGYGVSGSAVSVYWASWMKSLSPQECRGRLFAWRNRVFAMVQLGCTVAAGVLTRHYTADTAPWSFFLLVFCIAAAARGVSTLFINRQYEPPVLSCKETGSRTKTEGWFHTYAIGTALFNASAAIAGPFFGVWYLRDLSLDYLSFSLCSAATVAGTVLFLPVWGQLADRVGNLSVMRLAACMGALIPLPYLFGEAPWQLWVFSLYSGICWSGFNLGNFNYLLLASGEQESERHIALASAVGGVAVFCFGLLGGFLAPRLPEVLGYRLRTLFLLSMLLRVATVILFFPRFKPLVNDRLLSARELFDAIPGRRVGLGIMRNVYRSARRT